MPRDFMPVAEASGIIVSAGEWILREACLRLAQWQREYPEAMPLSVSVNVSARQLGAANLPRTIDDILRESGVNASSLKIEITESALIAEKEIARGVLAQISALGVGIELDDFGTGYASLSYLNMVHFESLKIDRSFVSRIESDSESRAIIRTILGLARELKMGVIAEGIETEVEAERLVEMGCRIGQGYYYSMPIEAAAVDRMLLEASQAGRRHLHADLQSQPQPELVA
jgi:EAL domain-containing protein (putative c-di-GMP-specific phosphodiesterase class I)